MHLETLKESIEHAQASARFRALIHAKQDEEGDSSKRLKFDRKASPTDDSSVLKSGKRFLEKGKGLETSFREDMSSTEEITDAGTTERSNIEHNAVICETSGKQRPSSWPKLVSHCPSTEAKLAKRYKDSKKIDRAVRAHKDTIADLIAQVDVIQHEFRQMVSDNFENPDFHASINSIPTLPSIGEDTEQPFEAEKGEFSFGDCTETIDALSMDSDFTSKAAPSNVNSPESEWAIMDGTSVSSLEADDSINTQSHASYVSSLYSELEDDFSDVAVRNASKLTPCIAIKSP